MLDHAPTTPNANDKAVAFLRQLAEKNFYGAITLKFQNGSVVHISRAESIFPNQLPEESRMYNYRAAA